MNSRRTFLKTTGLLSAGLMMDSSEFFARQKKKAGIQLYSLRDVIGKDVKSVIEKVSAAGYQEVEMFGLTPQRTFFGLNVTEFAKLMRANNLTSPSGHYLPAKFLFENGSDDEIKGLCDVAHAMGHEYLIVPWLPEEQRKTIDQYKALAPRINKAAEICKAQNIMFAYHNHDFEFADLGGQNGYEVLLKETDPNLLKMEADLYWIVSAGYNPVDLFKANPGRFHLWHVKDMNKDDKTQNTEIGNGSIDYKSIFKYARLAGARHYYMEQENNYKPDVLGSMVVSSDFMKKKLL